MLVSVCSWKVSILSWVLAVAVVYRVVVVAHLHEAGEADFVTAVEVLVVCLSFCGSHNSVFGIGRVKRFV